ncbi:hypothetical protein C1646_814772 [Rhizophagus diaphanus]|nr:hypothetical protein C1646_814772 [Rhizophagus diaphanus] [Rhizophagus sp. MUCL 43196]
MKPGRILNISYYSYDVMLSNNINDINDKDKDIGEQISKFINSSCINFIKSIKSTQSHDIKPTKPSLSITSSFYDIGEQTSIVKSPNVNPTKLTLTPMTLSNPPNQSTPAILSNPSNQSTPAILSTPTTINPSAPTLSNPTTSSNH